MRTPTITQEQVFAIADRLHADGKPVTLRAIRAAHGSGSLGTIQPALKLWQSRQLQGAEQKVELSPLLLRALQENISQTVAGARAELEAKLVASEEEAADLAHENERLTGDLDTLREQQEAAGLELATLQERNAQQEQQLQEALAAAAGERATVEALRQQLAEASLQLKALPKLEQDLAGARAAVDAERTARVKAEQAAAVGRAPPRRARARRRGGQGGTGRGRRQRHAGRYRRTPRGGEGAPSQGGRRTDQGHRARAQQRGAADQCAHRGRNGECPLGRRRALQYESEGTDRRTTRTRTRGVGDDRGTAGPGRQEMTR
jgi:hypothetical protein